MFTSIKRLVFSGTSRDSSVLMFGSALGAACTFIMTALLTRSLSPYDIGLFLAAFSFVQMIADFADMGLNSATVNFISGELDSEKKKFLRVITILKISIATVSACLVFLFADFIAINFFNEVLFTPYIRITALGIFLMILFLWLQNLAQSRRAFLSSAISTVLVNSLRLMLVGLFISFGMLNGVALFSLTQIVIAFGIFLLLRFISWKQVRVTFTDFKKVLLFSLPIGVSFAMWAIYSKLDSFFVLKYLGPQEAGFYGVAIRVISLTLLITAAYHSALAPRFSSIKVEDFKVYFQKSLFGSFIVGISYLLLIPLSLILLPLFFGAEYFQSVLPFQILVVGSLFFQLASTFNYAILYHYKNSVFALVSSVIYVCVVSALLYFFVQSLGIIGAALAMAVFYFIQLIISVMFFIYLGKK